MKILSIAGFICLPLLFFSPVFAEERIVGDDLDLSREVFGSGVLFEDLAKEVAVNVRLGLEETLRRLRENWPDAYALNGLEVEERFHGWLEDCLQRMQEAPVVAGAQTYRAAELAALNGDPDFVEQMPSVERFSEFQDRLNQRLVEVEGECASELYLLIQSLQTLGFTSQVQ